MKTRGRPGQTLVEVVMATVIAALTASAVFSVVLSSFVADARADKRDAAAMALRQAQQALKVYVSAEPSDPNYSPGAVAGRWVADNSNQWALRGMLCASNSPANVGTLHNISSIVAFPHPLSPDPASPATMEYRVCSYDCGFGTGPAPDYPLACKRVAFRLNYTD